MRFVATAWALPLTLLGCAPTGSSVAPATAPAAPPATVAAPPAAPAPEPVPVSMTSAEMPAAPRVERPFYVAIAGAQNATSRKTPEIDRRVRAVFEARLRAAPGVSLAPRGESAAAVKTTLATTRATGLEVLPRVDAFRYRDGRLQVHVIATVRTYPDRVLRGQVEKTVTKEDVSRPDRGAEDELTDVACEAVASELAGGLTTFAPLP